ncbi:MAG: META domain-containing protein [Bacteroides sp.]|nr:META domain-containing protein [Bacteroides sp.]
MNKRKSILIGLFSLSIILIMGCGTAKNGLSFSELNGEWNIIELQGDVVVPADNQPYPFVGFDTSTGRLYGNSGCNRMMSSVTPGGQVGEINIGNVAGTRMACNNMELEQKVLKAMQEVKRYKKLSGNNIALCDANNVSVMILAPKEGGASLASLNGEWFITTVNDEAVSFDMRKQPFISFDVSKEHVHGYSGCNTFNGGYKIDEKISNSLTFPALASTMMACMDMELEGKILKALDAVTTYKQTVEGLALLNAEGNRVMTLLKKK